MKNQNNQGNAKSFPPEISKLKNDEVLSRVDSETKNKKEIDTEKGVIFKEQNQKEEEVSNNIYSDGKNYYLNFILETAVNCRKRSK